MIIKPSLKNNQITQINRLNNRNNNNNNQPTNQPVEEITTDNRDNNKNQNRSHHRSEIIMIHLITTGGGIRITN